MGRFKGAGGCAFRKSRLAHLRLLEKVADVQHPVVGPVLLPLLGQALRPAARAARRPQRAGHRPLLLAVRRAQDVRPRLAVPTPALAPAPGTSRAWQGGRARGRRQRRWLRRPVPTAGSVTHSPALPQRCRVQRPGSREWRHGLRGIPTPFVRRCHRVSRELPAAPGARRAGHRRPRGGLRQSPGTRVRVWGRGVMQVRAPPLPARANSGDPSVTRTHTRWRAWLI